VIYSAELWDLTNKMESVNDVGMENIEKIHGPIYENIYYIIQINQEICIVA